MRKAKRAKAAPPEPPEAGPNALNKPAAKCMVCGDPVAQFSTEELCWVCRRLKISAWRESDNQMSGPE